MDIHEIDEHLETIKAYHTFLGEILEKGYNNNIDVIKSIVKNINHYIKTMMKSNDSDNHSDNNSDHYYDYNDTEDEKEEETEEEEEETEEEEEEEDNIKEKIELRIKHFMSMPTDLSKIYLYQKDKKYITEMNQYINNSFVY